jgi:hypothetical protein
MKIYKQSLALKEKDKTIDNLFTKIELLKNLNTNLMSQLMSEKSEMSSELRHDMDLNRKALS